MAKLLRLFLLALPLLTAACENFQPYWGRPGGMAPRLAAPPAYRLAVMIPPEALLTDEAARGFAGRLAQALEAAEVPAVTDGPWPLDWRLLITAEAEGDKVTPQYALMDADQKPLGTVGGQVIPARDWSEAAPATLSRIAERDAPKITALLASVEAARKANDPMALLGRPMPKMRFMGVKGAPGDGNDMLAARMRDFLGQQGIVVQDVAQGALYGLVADVTLTPVENNQERVEIQWIVTRADGYELGRVLQLNEVPKGSLGRFWGDVAYVVAQQASAGVRDVISNAGGLPPR